MTNTEVKYYRLIHVLKHYFDQNENYKPSRGHVPRQFVEFIGCKKCKHEHKDNKNAIPNSNV